MKIQYYAKTDMGRKRSNNEDFFLLPEPNKKYEVLNINKEEKGELVIICDGMGGGKAGEVASELSASWLLKGYYVENKTNIFELIKEIDKKLFELSSKYNEYQGMGSTLIAGLFKDDKLEVYSVGDSRLYCLRNGELNQITDDQSDVWDLYKAGEISKDEILTHPRKHIVNSAMGILIEELLTYKQTLKSNDLYLFCTDGITDLLYDKDIKEILNSKKDLKTIAEDLISKANEKGGIDNSTVILVYVS